MHKTYSVKQTRKEGKGDLYGTIIAFMDDLIWFYVQSKNSILQSNLISNLSYSG